MVMKVGIIGASGFVGGELLRLLLNHDDVEVSMVCSRKNAGDYLHRVHPNLRGFSNLQFTEPDVDKITNNCDLVFTAVPHGSAFDVINDLLKTDEYSTIGVFIKTSIEGHPTNQPTYL